MLLRSATNTYAAGEIGPDAWERADLAQHRAACAEALNFIGLVAGPNASRGGFLWISSPKYEDRATRKVRWLRSDAEGLVLEFGDFYARVWTARGEKVMDGGSQVEFAHPFSEALLAGLNFTQVGDIAIVTHRDGYYPRVIRRTSDTSWSVGYYQFFQGPWLPENADLGHTLTLSEVSSGIWNVVSNVALFTAGHVGSAFLVRANGGLPGLRSWAPNTAMLANQGVLSNGRVYWNTSGAGNSGNTPPSHDRGVVSDGALNWEFRHDGAGVVYITTVTDSMNAVAAVPYDIPFLAGGSATATTNWSEAAFSDARGWPCAPVAVREERMAFAATRTNPDVVEMTRTAGFNPTFADFKPGLGTGLVVDDDAVSKGVGQDRARVMWLVDAQNLVVGTTEGEFILSGGTVDDAIAPASITPRRLSSHGSAPVTPVVVQGPPSILLFVPRGGQGLREIVLSPDGGAEGRDLGILAEHIFGLGVKEMAWTRPDNNLWLRLDDDSLAVFTYHHEHGVSGARRQEIAGGYKVEALAASPDPDGRDRLHASVYREMDGGMMERANFMLAPRSANIWADCAQVYEGSPTASISGLTHLEGETIVVVADGARVTPDPVVEAGGFTLAEPASLIVYGLAMRRRFMTLPLVPDQEVNGALASPRQGLVVLRCVEARVGHEPQNEPEAIGEFEEVRVRQPQDPGAQLRRTAHKVTFQGGADRDNRIVIETAAPFDLVMLAHRVNYEMESEA